jgi:hypothetical protein
MHHYTSSAAVPPLEVSRSAFLGQKPRVFRISSGSRMVSRLNRISSQFGSTRLIDLILGVCREIDEMKEPRTDQWAAFFLK